MLAARVLAALILSGAVVGVRGKTATLTLTSSTETSTTTLTSSTMTSTTTLTSTSATSTTTLTSTTATSITTLTTLPGQTATTVTETSTTTLQYKVVSKLQFQSTGTAEDVENVTAGYLIDLYKVSPDQLSLTVTEASGGSGRRLTTSWTVDFEVVADQGSAEQIRDTTQAISDDPSTMAQSLSTSFAAKGITLDTNTLSVEAPQMLVITNTMTTESETGTTTFATATSATATSTTTPLRVFGKPLKENSRKADTTKTVLIVVFSALGGFAILGTCGYACWRFKKRRVEEAEKEHIVVVDEEAPPAAVAQGTGVFAFQAQAQEADGESSSSSSSEERPKDEDGNSVYSV